MNLFKLMVLIILCSTAFSTNYAAVLPSFNTEKLLLNSVDTIFNPDFGIGGYVKTANNVNVKGVTIFSYLDSILERTTKTENYGTFFLGFFPYPYFDKNFTMKAQKLTTEDKYVGVSTFDISRISKHLLGVDTFTNVDQFLAADVNNDHEIDAVDMLILRNFVLRRSAYLPKGIWQFIDKNYKFSDPNNPLIDIIPEGIYLPKLTPFITTNFLAIKYGDVNNTYISNAIQPQVRNDKALNLHVEDQDLLAGEEYTIQFVADNFNAIAFQGTFSLGHATIQSVKAGDLENYSDGNFGLFKNAITTSWNGSAKANSRVFNITFVAEKTTRLSDILTINSDLTPSVANDIEGNELAIHLHFSNKINKVNKANSFELYQNVPNPTDFSTNITFNLPNESPSKLTLSTLNGKIILSKNIDGKAGLNTINIQKSDLNHATGVLFYRLETAGFAATKRMIVLK